MCGIVAYIGNAPGFDISLEGIKILQNRGYDSCGVASLSSDKSCINISKFASKGALSGVDLIEEKGDLHRESHLLTFHTRWATSGSICDKNAHPHQDNQKRISVVHNGIIENYQNLKDFLLQKDYFFTSETDTEVIAVLIGYYLDQGNQIDTALEYTLNRLEGTWGLVVLSLQTPDCLYLCKNGSPLIIGFEDNFALIASESSAVLNHVKKYFIMDDHQILNIGLQQSGIQIRTKSQLVNLDNCQSTQGEIEDYMINNNTQSPLISQSPDPYPHWMLKEIWEQPASIMRTLNNGGRLLDDKQVHLGGLESGKDELLKIRHLLILGCGTSYHAGLLGAKYFKLLHSVHSVQVIDASEFSLKDIPRPFNEVGILVLSQSGETKDVHRAMEIAEQEEIFIFSIVNVVGSLIAREASCGIYLNAGREVAVASTKSFTSQVVALSLVAIWFAQRNESSLHKRRDLISGLRHLSFDFEHTLKIIEPQCTLIIPELIDYHSMFILGRDLGEPIAYEGALKIKEVSYIHAEGYSGGSLKHGPFALIETGTPIIVLMFDDEYSGKMEIAADEVTTRGAHVILITNKKPESLNHKLYRHIIYLPENKYLGPLLAVAVLQYLSYLLAIELEHNPDYPRNLAKVVTVDG